MSTTAGRSLRWGIKTSLLRYVRDMPDGRVEAANGAAAVEGGFVFGSAGGLAFRGTVTLTGHHGMMRVVIADPAFVQTASGWSLEIADPDEPGTRLRFATINAFDAERATGTALTTDGADLFFGPYTAGTPLDDPIVVP